jgi:diaminopimelate decarboxylase
MEIDVIREEVQLPRLALGDRLTLWPVGAYNLGQSMQFIHLRPEVVLLDLDGGVHVIRRQEELRDMNTAELLPAYLAGGGDD